MASLSTDFLFIYNIIFQAMVTRKPRLEQELGSLLIRAVPNTSTSTGTSATTTSASASASASFESTASDASQATRASHTPAVRSGPPLSCNFCWNTVDECGRILRRKTQYHCPECRTNLCIVPCFHEYHDGPESDSNTANARWSLFLHDDTRRLSKKWWQFSLNHTWAR